MDWKKSLSEHPGKKMEMALRCIPYGLTMVAANVVHYRSLWGAKEAAVRRMQARQRLLLGESKEHEPLTFDLMGSPEMRRARYKIKLLRYGITLFHLLLFYNQLQELQIQQFRPGWGTLEAPIVGLLMGLITIYLDENRHLALRTPWNPALDFKSRALGVGWDVLRVAGGCFAVPIEEELFYHSWLYRYLVKFFHGSSGYNSFTDVPFRAWSWPLCLAANGFFALHNGMEWRSCLLGGLLFQWVIAARGQFLDGLLAHVVCNSMISFWVVVTGQRQYW